MQCKLQTYFTFKFRLKNLYFNSQNSHTTTLDVTICENQSAAVTERVTLYTLSIICDSIDLSNTLSKPLHLSL